MMLAVSAVSQACFSFFKQALAAAVVWNVGVESLRVAAPGQSANVKYGLRCCKPFRTFGDTHSTSTSDAGTSRIDRNSTGGSSLPFDDAAAAVYARTRGDRDRAGRPISINDAMIAAIARTRGGTLATRNVADFEHCGISIVDPWTAPGRTRPGGALS